MCKTLANIMVRFRPEILCLLIPLPLQVGVSLVQIPNSNVSQVLESCPYREYPSLHENVAVVFEGYLPSTESLS